MIIKIELTKAEASKLFGEIVSQKLAPGASLRVTEVEWTAYGQRVEITATDAPDEDNKGGAA